MNDDPDAAAADKVTVEDVGKLSEQSLPQLIPPGLLVTVPLPLPALVTVKVAEVGRRPKLAVTVREPVIVTEHVVDVVDVQPVHPCKTEPDAAAAVSDTRVPDE